MDTQENDISWALKLLEREPEYEPNFLSANWAYICGTFTGFIIPASMNLWLKRPVWTGIHRHFLSAAGGYGVGHLIIERERNISAHRDAIMRDYIRLHPEDFPPPQRKKYAELFESWTPIR